MYLRRITITGFKSFAGKTVLDLEPGIAAVVGPNGSGKSNLADAIRWTLGEQSKGRLRLTDREEVVFAGSPKRARASYAEVILLFDNEDGAFPLDLTEVEISRRLYRSGETDYRLAGRSVRLADIQSLLAGAGFGAGTYAVIGQGMIDSFLMSSPSERKLLFDEAAGIRAPELKREAALRKLGATTTNLTRLRDISAELAPHLAALSRSVSAKSERQELDVQIHQLRQELVSVAHSESLERQEAIRYRLRVTAHTSHRRRHETRQLERELAAGRRFEEEQYQARHVISEAIVRLEAERDAQGLQLSNARASVAEAERMTSELSGLTKSLATARTELAVAMDQAVELESQLASANAGATRAERAVSRANEDVVRAQEALVELRDSSLEGTRDQYLDHALQVLRTLALDLSASETSLEHVKLLVHKAGRLLSHATRTGAAELLSRLQEAQSLLERAMLKRETATEHQTNITITRRSLEIDLGHQHDIVARSNDTVERLNAQILARQLPADEIKRRDSTYAATASAIARTTKQLEVLRRRLSLESSQRAAGSKLAAIAGALERAKAAEQSAATDLARLGREAAQARELNAQSRAWAKEWGVSPKLHVAHTAPISELESDLLRLQAQRDARSSIEDAQAADFEATRARHEQMAEQIADLENAHADLSRVVEELNGLIKARFKENFQALSEQFSLNFYRLFDGGAASLELIEEEGGSYGVEIKASPKGKRLSSLTSLSGGERAMAGVALLAAILKVNPSPFVVLDEIDAALDEANSGRLALILDELQEQSQLIVITHNRQTMRSAKVLFGVTMNEHHVSHLLSIKIQEATELAAR